MSIYKTDTEFVVFNKSIGRYVQWRAHGRHAMVQDRNSASKYWTLEAARGLLYSTEKERPEDVLTILAKTGASPEKETSHYPTVYEDTVQRVAPRGPEPVPETYVIHDCTVAGTLLAFVAGEPAPYNRRVSTELRDAAIFTATEATAFLDERDPHRLEIYKAYPASVVSEFSRIVVGKDKLYAIEQTTVGEKK